MKSFFKPEIFRFWIPTTSSVGRSDFKFFVKRSDYNKLLKAYKELLIASERKGR